MLRYPARITTTDDGRVTAFLTNLPEVTSTCDSEGKAIRKLRPLLRNAVRDRVTRGVPLPEASDICGAPLIGIRNFWLE